MKEKVEAELLSSAMFFDKLKWLTTKEAALYLRRSPEAIRVRVHRGTLKAYRDGRELRFLRSDLDKQLKPTSR
jgi:excisionase family DNA binding protein